MSETVELLVRTIKTSPKILADLASGQLQLWGGVIRVSKGFAGAGQIVSHLTFPSDPKSAEEAIKGVKQLIYAQNRVESSIGALQESMNGMRLLQIANTAISGLNLAVSIAGFTVVCNKLNNISSALSTQSAKLDAILQYINNDKIRNNFKDTAAFNALLKSISDFQRMGDFQNLRGCLTSLHENYEFTRFVLLSMADKRIKEDWEDFPEELVLLRDRLVHLGLANAFIKNEVSDYVGAKSALKELSEDWLKINLSIVSAINSDKKWIEFLKSDRAKSIKEYIEYRKLILPMLEYQSDIYDALQKNPKLKEISMFSENDILLIAA